ncbi:methylated-DNA--[protein]-cysteine S-methyltransferase [Polymorphobacter sp.]|uniref:methylated-DNA--[protein]-cysteine S-methyltransferase n=1 Tax=Polymorphobacter sp. TaxID=1909290 RepID=UPI003F729809
MIMVSRFETPLGRLLIASRGDGVVVAMDFEDFEARFRERLGRDHGESAEGEVPQAVGAALARYFGGDVGALGGVAAAPAGSEFQQRVWAALRAIPAGETRSYGEIARVLGQTGASRAVGLANGRNPVALVIPCHRVIGGGGGLTGYAGGMERKAWLLRHEGAMAALLL